MHIDWWTLAFQAVNFLVLVWVLQHFLYKPVRRAIDKRRDEAEGAFTEARQREARADAAKADYVRKAEDLDAERRQMISELRQEADREKEKVLTAAREQAQEIVAAARAQVDEEQDALSLAYREKAAELAVEMSRALIEGAEAPSVAETALAHVVDHLDGLDKAARDRLLGPRGGDGTVSVTTWPALDAKAIKRWRERLGEHLSPGATLDFATDERLLGGARAEFPGATVDFSWAGTLERAARDLTDEAP